MTSLYLVLLELMGPNIADIVVALRGKSFAQVNSIANIQKIINHRLDELKASAPIPDPFAQISLSQFTQAGITGLTETNIQAIKKALYKAYTEGTYSPYFSGSYKAGPSCCRSSNNCYSHRG